MKKRLSDLIDKISDDDILSMSASLAYYTAMSLAPLLILLVSLLSILKIKMDFELVAQIHQLFGGEAAKQLETMLEKIEPKTNILSLADLGGILTLGISASVVFAQLQSSLNKIFNCELKNQVSPPWHHNVRDFMLRRLFCFGMVFTFIFISIVSLIVSTVLAMVVNKTIGAAGEILHGAMTMVIYSLLFSAMFKWIPDCEVKWKSVWKSGLITAIMFMIGKSLIGSYLGQTAVASAYGAAGSLVILLIWVYYSTLIFFIGAEVSSNIHADDETKKSMA